MKRTLSLVLACVCLLAFLVTECDADCSGSRRISAGQVRAGVKSALQKIAAVPAKVVENKPVRSLIIRSGCSKPSGTCSLQESHDHLSGCSGSSVSEAPAPQPELTSSSKYQIALASASTRAATGNHGHVSGEVGNGLTSRSGVGYASHDSNPKTCLGIPGRTRAVCAVVRGADGLYSTCVE